MAMTFALTMTRCSGWPGISHGVSGTGSAELKLSTGDIATGPIDMKLFRGAGTSDAPIISMRIDAHPVHGVMSAYLGALFAGDYIVDFHTTDTKTRAPCDGRQTFRVVASETLSVSVSLACS